MHNDNHIIINTECRICLENTDNNTSYCKCKGTIQYIHRECLIDYINKSKNKIENNCIFNKIKCDICNSYILFYSRKEKKYYLSILASFVLLILLNILIYIYLNKHINSYLILFLYLLLFVLYLLINYYSLKYFNLLTKKIYLIKNGYF
jgi:E3 ubiquitin-protein ligase DOA10